MPGIFNTKLNPVICLIFFLVFFAGRWTDILKSVPERAEEAYNGKQYQKALELFQEAQTHNPDSDTLAYNLGNTLYQLGRYDDAAAQYGRILGKESPGIAPNALYNMGNTLFQMGKQSANQEFFKNSLEAYKHSIKLEPKDEDAKYNYELVKRFLKEQEQQQKNQQQKDNKQKEQEQQNQDKSQNQKDQEKDKQKEQNQQQQEQQQQKQQEQQAQPQEARQKPGQMSKEEAERILNALIRMEKEMQEKEKEKKVMERKGRGPDW
ncbi:MAG TPA: tetratricopeptide repeat protein [archaeon]|nr:tetratricopeptide repeat protein [archaeon]